MRCSGDYSKIQSRVTKIEAVTQKYSTNIDYNIKQSAILQSLYQTTLKILIPFPTHMGFSAFCNISLTERLDYSYAGV